MNNASTQEQENSIYEQMIVDKENNTISFFFDNQYYQIPIKNSYDNNLKKVETIGCMIFFRKTALALRRQIHI